MPRISRAFIWLSYPCLVNIGCTPTPGSDPFQNQDTTNNGGSSNFSTNSGGASNSRTSSASGGSSATGTSGRTDTGGTSNGGTSASAGGTTMGVGGSDGRGGSGNTEGGMSSASGGKSTEGKGGGGNAPGAGGSSGKTSAVGGSGAGGRNATGTGGRNSSGGTAGPAGGRTSTTTTTTTTTTTSPAGDCSITVTNGAVSSAMATVGVVEWSTTLSNLSSAQVVYTLNDAGSSILNKGGIAPVNLKNASYRTLLLGLKQSSTYTFHVEATSSSGATCKSADATLKTGALSGAPNVTRTATTPSAQALGFIVTSGGQGTTGKGAYIIDADGAVVWYADAPTECSRAHMDYEGANMWMVGLNVSNRGGEMRFVSMDGKTVQKDVSGLSGAHHDFTVLPGKIAAMVWTTSGTDPESNLVERASDGSGSNTTVFKIGSNLYAGGQSVLGGGGNTYHCNSIVYHAEDDSYTIGDRNPNLYVKVTHSGTPVWQIGGTCTGAKAPKCATGTWKVNHGHDIDSNGNLLIFNNGQSGTSHAFEFKLSESSSSISYTTVKDFTSGTTSSMVLGDVQRLPNGNTLVTFSTSGQIVEVDSSWKTVQTLKVTCGYTDWRETLYGPPSRN